MFFYVPNLAESLEHRIEELRIMMRKFMYRGKAQVSKLHLLSILGRAI